MPVLDAVNTYSSLEINGLNHRKKEQHLVFRRLLDLMSVPKQD